MMQAEAVAVRSDAGAQHSGKLRGQLAVGRHSCPAGTGAHPFRRMSRCVSHRGTAVQTQRYDRDPAGSFRLKALR